MDNGRSTATEQVVTIWKDGTWKVWGAMDAFYAQSDEDYLLTIALKELTEQNEEASADG